MRRGWGRGSRHGGLRWEGDGGWVVEGLRLGAGGVGSREVLRRKGRSFERG